MLELTLLLRAGPLARKLPPKSQNRASPSSLWGCLWRGAPAPAGRGQSQPSCLRTEPPVHRPADMGQKYAQEWTRDQRAGGSQASWAERRALHASPVVTQVVMAAGSWRSRSGAAACRRRPFLRGRVRHSKSTARKEKKRTFPSSINS